MIKSLIPKIIILLLISISSCKTQQKKVLQEHYTFKKGDYNGIGKWCSVSIIVNLVSSIQKHSKTELTMNIIKIYQE